MDGLRRLNRLPEPAAREALGRCCGSSRWVAGMLKARPFAGEEELFEAAESVWRSLDRADWLEAFAAHPRIGDKEAPRSRSASTRDWAGSEQSGASAASEETLEALASGNRRYERRFGHIFIVCAAGKSASEMLGLLEARLGNKPEAELALAAAEQAKITRLRLERLLSEL